MLAPFANTVKYAGRNRPAGATPQTPDAEERQIEDVRRAARFARDKMRLNPAEASFAVSTQHDAHQVSVEYLAGIIGRIIEIEGPTTRTRWPYGSGCCGVRGAPATAFNQQWTAASKWRRGNPASAMTAHFT
jgi:hypothetical protein